MNRDDLTLAGDHMKFRVDDKGTAHIEFSDKPAGRVCGSCTLCCKVLPILEIKKAAGTRCQHARHGKGCTIYKNRPWSCRTWSCRWLSDAETAGMPRPDRCHYVIDLTEDNVIANDVDDPTNKATIPVIQVWVDPAFRDAYKAPELRSYMLMMAERHRVATIVRWSSTDAIVVFPPPITRRDEWIEQGGDVVARNELEQRIMDIPL